MSERPIPEELMEAARNLRNAVIWQSNASVEPIARALMAAHEAGRSLAAPHIGMTRQQKRLLDFIADYAAERGYGPSFDEMTEAMGLKSKSGIHRMVVALEERGFIRRMPNRARAIEIVNGARQ